MPTAISAKPGILLDNSVVSRSFVIRKYKTAATTLLRSKRIQESKQLNNQSAAYKLPSELLVKVFLACAQPSGDDGVCSWINVSFVCSTWRRAALECRELWSYIDFSHSRWTALCLRRAYSSPISIHTIVRDENQRSVQRALQFAYGIRDIHIRSSIHNVDPLMGALGSPGPVLRSLIVEITQPEDNLDIRFSKHSFQAPGPPLPQLRCLELHRSPFGLVSPRYTGLTRLSLHYLPFSERPSRHDFLTLLEKFRMLEHLTLVRAFPKNVVAGNTAPFCCIQLPKLRSIDLTGSAQELTNIFDCIAVQSKTCIRFTVDRMGDYKTNFWKLAKSIGTHLHKVAAAMPLDTLVVSSWEESYRFSGGYDLNSNFKQALRIRAFRADPECSGAVLDLIVGPDCHTSQDAILVAAMGAIWDLLPLTQVNTLTLQNVDVITQKSWPKLLSRLCSLRVLDIAGHAPSGLIWALLLNARSHSHFEHDDTSNLLLPHLDDIYLHNLDCFAGGLMVSQTAPINSYNDLDDSRFLDLLLAYLEDRHRCGPDLRSLSISSCNHVSTQVMAGLRECVSHLLWDSYGLYKAEELDPESPATYRTQWRSNKPSRRHFFRLKTLLQLE